MQTVDQPGAATRERPRRERIALVLGGGAPTLTLMAGALAALDKRGVKFDVLSTSGAGMLVGLLYAAPRGGDRQRALRATVDLGVHDAIYRRFPINYKVFYKPGFLAGVYYRRVLAPLMGLFEPQADWSRLLKDLAHFWLAAASPWYLTPSSLGMCQPAPWLEGLIDFEAFKRFEPAFFMNAWNIREQEMEIFAKEQITPDHFRAALAFPFIYPPFRLDGDWYIEGSAMRTLNLDGLLRHDAAYDRLYPIKLAEQLEQRFESIKRAYAKGASGQRAAQGLVKEAEWAAHKRAIKERHKAKEMSAGEAAKEAERRRAGLEGHPLCRAAFQRRDKIAGRIDTIDRIVVFDVLGTERLIRKPENLYDAWTLSIIVPLVSISHGDLKLFEKLYDDVTEEDPRKLVHRLSFAHLISPDQWPHVLDWSYSNLETLFEVGRRAGDLFFESKPWLRQRAA